MLKRAAIEETEVFQMLIPCNPQQGNAKQAKNVPVRNCFIIHAHILPHSLN